MFDIQFVVARLEGTIIELIRLSCTVALPLRVSGRSVYNKSQNRCKSCNPVSYTVLKGSFDRLYTSDLPVSKAK